MRELLMREPKKQRATNERATNKGAKKKRAKNSKQKGSNDEDAVGIDDEGIYSDNESLVAHSDISYDSNLAESSDSDCSDPLFDPNQEIVDEDDDDDVPVFAYDVQDPCIDVSVVFADVDQCKLAVTHHDILNDHAFETVKKDKKRFRAICKRAEEGCKWCFFASTSPKYIGCKVKTSGPKHTCGSFNKCGETMVTTKWVADRVVDLLRDNPSRGAKDLQEELNRKHQIDIPYFKVFRGREST
ncbi:uncharacterized protein LOC127775884 [Oryza glaberrima]|uniref:uncharacterized protein LOC127775884 n=1 Tax=Oryza glaberrima TaxID=4538 RepID=UPI00224C5F99|nr:uncharacterized protein LOC127775884 [Oryza glaberrima]